MATDRFDSLVMMGKVGFRPWPNYANERRTPEGPTTPSLDCSRHGFPHLRKLLFTPLCINWSRGGGWGRAARFWLAPEITWLFFSLEWTERASDWLASSSRLSSHYRYACDKEPIRRRRFWLAAEITWPIRLMVALPSCDEPLSCLFFRWTNGPQSTDLMSDNSTTDGVTFSFLRRGQLQSADCKKQKQKERRSHRSTPTPAANCERIANADGAAGVPRCRRRQIFFAFGFSSFSFVFYLFLWLLRVSRPSFALKGTARRPFPVCKRRARRCANPRWQLPQQKKKKEKTSKVNREHNRAVILPPTPSWFDVEADKMEKKYTKNYVKSIAKRKIKWFIYTIHQQPCPSMIEFPLFSQLPFAKKKKLHNSHWIL